MTQEIKISELFTKFRLERVKLGPSWANAEISINSSAPWLGGVPSHWDLVQLGRIGKFSKGIGGTKEDEVLEGVPCVRYGDLYTSHKYHIQSTRSFVTETKATRYTPIRYGDVLFAGSGETIEEIGKSAVNLMRLPACSGGDVILFRPDIEMDARFSGYAIDCPQSQYQKSCMGRGVTIMHIYGDELKRLWIALPPLAEQTVIVRYLDHAADRIRRYISGKERLIALLEEQKQAHHQPGGHSWSRPQRPTQALQHAVARRRAGALGGAAAEDTMQHEKWRWHHSRVH